MSAYVIAQISIHDRTRYERYAAGFMPVLAKYGGRLLAADEQPQVMQGAWGHQKVIVMQFDDHDSALRWSNSAEYQEISRDRLAATDGVALLVAGVGS
jgi:uncharacterized protein (DUF1330 family)